MLSFISLRRLWLRRLTLATKEVRPKLRGEDEADERVSFENTCRTYSLVLSAPVVC